MGLSITKKILSSHLLEGNLSAKEQITIKVDQTLWSDLTGIMGTQILESVQADKVSTNPSIIYCDHNTIATSTENSDDHLYMRTAAQRFGIYYSKPGNGICHFLHCQRFARPGQIMLGADSHTPTSGALGMIAIGSGGLSVAKSMLGEGFRLTTPKVLNIKLTGKLQPGVSAKDVTLEALRILSVKGGIGYIIEFTGDGIKNLSVPQRATIANMSIEMGATTGIFPSDEVTRAFLKAQGREEDWIELLPDVDAEYDKVLEINLSQLEPLVAKPHMPDLVVRAREVNDIKAGSVFIGSCTNASYSDIVKAAKILKGRKVHKEIDLTVGPGSKQVLEQLIEDGVLKDLVEAGARILECACGPCIGIGQAPPGKGVAVRTSNRNFPGRSSTTDASVYLVSPETAAATAITGKITDPRDIFAVEILQGCEEPAVYKIDDSMIITPNDVEDYKNVEIIRGENIVPLPERGALNEAINATVVLKLGDNITTDDIIPGGSNILKYIANIPKFAEFTFCYTDPTFVERAKELKHSVIIGGDNYGQGSSREHAALLPMFLGVEAVLAKSYARIHKENLINYGILPLVFKNKEDYEKIDMDDVFAIHDVYAQVDKGEVTVKVVNKDIEFVTSLELSDYDKRVLKEGGAVNYLKNKLK
ncbi:aconitate hydratase [Sporomusa malonica]|uniref:Aconitase n=1 Tax=Sporomusa malonica TaxID=112901 RepID=A0A1W1YAG8_9FIRM|nr:aconitate hydratase [Sporomusa malonica]SMC33146.1 aconitase [Sporomusa malonica]